MWIHIPKTSSASTQEEVDSTLDLDWLFPMLEQSVTWRETSHPAAYWSKRCKQVYWMMHLFGQIPTPSMASRGVEKWIGSLEDSPVNHGQSQEQKKEQKTNDGFGTTSNELLAKYDPKESSWKTCQVSLLDTESTPYLERFPNWGMTQDGVMSKLPMSELPTVGQESSSWRTSAASDGEGGVKEMRKGLNSQYKLRDHSANVVANWMTPNTMDALPPKSLESMKKQFQGVRKGRKSPSNLREQVIPQLHPKAWSTPSTRDWKGSSPNSHRTANLDWQTEHAIWMSSPQDPNQKSGKESGKKDQTSPQPWKSLRLNPMFVEWLMGWMWDLTGLTDSGYSATESYLYKQVMHLNYLWTKYKQ